MTIRDGWGSPNPVFRHFFTSNFVAAGPPEVAASFDEFQRMATSTENALRLWEMNAELDASDLAKQVRVPTLVLHCESDRVAQIDEDAGWQSLFRVRPKLLSYYTVSTDSV